MLFYFSIFSVIIKVIIIPIIIPFVLPIIKKYWLKVKKLENIPVVRDEK